VGPGEVVWLGERSNHPAFPDVVPAGTTAGALEVAVAGAQRLERLSDAEHSMGWPWAGPFPRASERSAPAMPIAPAAAASEARWGAVEAEAVPLGGARTRLERRKSTTTSRGPYRCPVRGRGRWNGSADMDEGSEGEDLAEAARRAAT